MKPALLAMCPVLLAAISGLAISCSTTQSPRRQVDDVKITAEVKSKLASDGHLSSLTNIDVNTTNGVVTLAGQVENDQIKARAEAIARNVEGVAKVNNNLQVEPASVVQPDRTTRPPR